MVIITDKKEIKSLLFKYANTITELTINEGMENKKPYTFIPAGVTRL